VTSFPSPPGGGDDNAPKRRRFVAIAPVAPPVEAANEPQAAANDDEDFPLLTEVVNVAAAEPAPESDTTAATEPPAPLLALPAEDSTLPAQPTPEVRASLLETLPPFVAAGAPPRPTGSEEGPPVSLVTPLSADLARALEARLTAALPDIVAEAQEAAQAVLRQRIEAATQAAIEGALADLLHATPPLPDGDHPA